MYDVTPTIFDAIFFRNDTLLVLWERYDFSFQNSDVTAHHDPYHTSRDV